MKTTLLAGMCGILVMSAVSNHADAHPARTKQDLRARNFLAMSPTQPTAPVALDGMLLRGPTNEPLSTATGGPVGGLPDRN